MASLFKRFTNSLRRDKGLDSDLLGGAWDSVFGGSSGQGNSNAWLSTFHTNPRFAALNKLVNDTGVSDYGIYEDSKDIGRVSVLNHPLAKEIDSHTVPMFFSLWSAYRYMTGEVYIAFDGSRTHGPKNFRVYTTTHIQSEDETSITFKEGTTTRRYLRKNIIIDRDLDITDPYNKGYGRAKAIMAEVESDEVIQRYLNTFYVNNARADIYISPKGIGGEVPSDDELMNFASQLRNFHQGVENSHKTAVLSFPADIATAPSNHMEMELLSTRKYLRDISIQHFSIPPEIMGIIENSNKATVVAAEHIYAKQVRLPLLKHFQDIINSKLLPLYPDSSTLYFEFYDILPDDTELNITVAKEGREGKSLTLNEHRQLLGFPKLVGDVGNTLVGYDLVAATTTSEEVTTVGEDGEEVTEVIETPVENPAVVEVEPRYRHIQDRDVREFKDYQAETVKEKTKKATGGLVEDDKEEFYVTEGES